MLPNRLTEVVSIGQVLAGCRSTAKQREFVSPHYKTPFEHLFRNLKTLMKPYETLVQLHPKPLHISLWIPSRAL